VPASLACRLSSCGGAWSSSDFSHACCRWLPITGFYQGTALDWRLAHGDVHRTRTTVDLDFVCRVRLEQARADLAAATAVDLGDYFTFALDPTAQITEAEGRSFRFHITASLGPRPYLMFLVDVGLVDPLRWAPDRIVVTDPFGDLGFGPLTVPTLPIPHQVAEKVHAITKLTREGRPRTRVVQDVADLVLIAMTERPTARETRAALTAVFAAYNTHPLPIAMPATPREWARDYRAAAEELRIPSDLDTADAVVGGFLNGYCRTLLAGSGTPALASGVIHRADGMPMSIFCRGEARGRRHHDIRERSSICKMFWSGTEVALGHSTA
jgi:hypothetical protein